ncbi:MAG: hypothetical protein KF850_41675 [Labilithrix sp.]|nr:hypothetical protein [Labilithrix sp.]MBX3218590.1 hypothetical protein [Labilithrix sp.]
MPSIVGDDDGSGFGVRGNASAGIGVVGLSESATGVGGGSKTGDGIRAVSLSGRGVFARSGGDAIVGETVKQRGVVGISADGAGVSGESQSDNGVVGRTKGASRAGVFGLSEPGEGGNGVTGLARGLGGVGVFGSADARGVGVSGTGATGMLAFGDAGPGLSASSEQQHGVMGLAKRTGFAGVYGEHRADATGVFGKSTRGKGVEGVGRYGVWGACEAGQSTGCGVVGTRGNEPAGGWQAPVLNAAMAGVFNDTAGWAVIGVSTSRLFPAVAGISKDPLSLSPGVEGEGAFCGVRGTISLTTPGVAAAVEGSAKFHGHVGIRGTADSTATGVFGSSTSGAAVVGWCSGDGVGVYGFSPSPTNVNGYAFAAIFQGAVNVTGPVHKSGGGFLIDHPEDPEGKFLSHSFVESDERKNIYDGIVELDEEGSAEVRLPVWLEALNDELRYQLTAIGGPAPELHVARELRGGSFQISGGNAGQRVSWQLTGRRRDAWATANPQSVEIEKSSDEQGRYRHPELFGHGDEKNIDPFKRRLDPLQPRTESDDEMLDILNAGTLPGEGRSGTSAVSSS